MAGSYTHLLYLGLTLVLLGSQVQGLSVTDVALTITTSELPAKLGVDAGLVLSIYVSDTLPLTQAQVDAFDWQTHVRLQEGFFDPIALNVAGNITLTANVISIPLSAASHHTTAAMVPFTFQFAERLFSIIGTTSFESVPVIVYRSGTGTEGTRHFNVVSKICTKLLGATVVGTHLYVDSLQSAQLLAASRCTIWSGSITFRGLSMSDEEWSATLASLHEVESALVIDQCDGFSFHHIPDVFGVGTGLNPMLHTELSPLLPATTGARFSFLVHNSTNLGSVNLIRSRKDVAKQGAFGVVNNQPPICYKDADVLDFWWTDTNKVIVQYNDTSCPASCPLFTNTGCTNVCGGLDCPTYCQGGIVSQKADMARYKGCTDIIGTLAFINMPAVSESVFEDAFDSLTAIEGSLVITDNSWLVGLEFLNSLSRVNRIFIRGNKRLVDARLPGLLPATAATTVVYARDNDRLCETAEPFGTEACVQVLVSSRFNVPDFNTALFNATNVTTMFREVLGQPSANVLSYYSETDTDTTILYVEVLDDVSNSINNLNILSDINTDELSLQFKRFRHGYIFNNISFASPPSRLPEQGSGYDYGITISANFIDGKLKISWTEPGDAPDAIAVFYRVEYAPRVPKEIEQQFAEYLASTGLVEGDEDVVIERKAQEGLAQLFDYRSISARSANSAELPACQQIQGDVITTLSRACLQPDLQYEVRVVGQIGLRRVYSNSIFTRTEDIQLIVTDIAGESTSPSHSLATYAPKIKASWNEPYIPSSVTYQVLGYTIQVRYATENNGLLTKTGASQQFSKELLELSSKQRLYNVAALRNLEISGCFHDYALNRTHCLKPFTTYRITIRTLSSGFHGAPSDIYITTPEITPTVSPTVTVASNQESVVTLNVKRPNPSSLLSIITGYRVVYTSNEGPGLDGEYTETIPDAASAQLNTPSQATSISVANLRAYTTYNFEVYALTSAGASPSRTVEARTAETVPGMMAAITIGRQQARTGQVHISWDAPNPLPGVIIYYEVVSGYKTSEEPGEIVYHGLELEAYVQSNTTDLRVRAATSKGAGPWSELPAEQNQSGIDVFLKPYVIGTLIGVLLLVIVAAVMFAVKRRSQLLLEKALQDEFVAPPADKWEYPRSKLTMGRHLGEGAFGVVCEAIAAGIRELEGNVKVAVKQCSDDTLSAQEKNDFLREAELMKKFSDPHHNNVVRMLGVVTQDEPLLIITEYMANGDLKNFLRKSRATAEAPSSLSLADLLYMAADVSAGMAYLSSKKFVHRDLACRNCLVSENLTTKVGDFGLSRSLDYAEYYRKNGEALLPVRWMDPLALCSGRYTTETDVWSFGIVLWEIMTYGRMPYPNQTNNQVFEGVIAGHRLPQPTGCPDGVYDLMWNCWLLENRPTFESMEATLTEIGRSIELGTITQSNTCSVGGVLGGGYKRVEQPLPEKSVDKSSKASKDGKAGFEIPSEATAPAAADATSYMAMAADDSAGVVAFDPEDVELQANPAYGQVDVEAKVPRLGDDNIAESYCDMSDANVPRIKLRDNPLYALNTGPVQRSERPHSRSVKTPGTTDGSSAMYAAGDESPLSGKQLYDPVTVPQSHGLPSNPPSAFGLPPPMSSYGDSAEPGEGDGYYVVKGKFQGAIDPVNVPQHQQSFM
eukprot:m.255857 g.255857  ORF g.255857 m.255857 type:complete len:1647 (+) comp15510_c1_seq1:574-5514(+)